MACRSTTTPERSAQRRQVDDEPAAACRAHSDATHLPPISAQAQRTMRESGGACVVLAAIQPQGRGPALLGPWKASISHPRLKGLRVGSLPAALMPPAAQPGFDCACSWSAGGHRRHAPRQRGWIHNVAQGARCEPLELTPELRQRPNARPRRSTWTMPAWTSSRAARRWGTGAGGQWRGGVAGLAAVTRTRIAQAIVDDLLDRKIAASRHAAMVSLA
jgi:hypothetical protein